jgi:hypothetical protein
LEFHPNGGSGCGGAVRKGAVADSHRWTSVASYNYDVPTKDVCVVHEGAAANCCARKFSGGPMNVNEYSPTIPTGGRGGCGDSATVAHKGAVLDDCRPLKD